MYFESRAHAGQKLAAELVEKYRYENCAIVALSDGGVIVGEQIAAAREALAVESPFRKTDTADD